MVPKRMTKKMIWFNICKNLNPQKYLNRFKLLLITMPSYFDLSIDKWEQIKREELLMTYEYLFKNNPSISCGYATFVRYAYQSSTKTK